MVTAYGVGGSVKKTGKLLVKCCMFANGVKFVVANICFVCGIYHNSCHCGKLCLPTAKETGVALFQHGPSVQRPTYILI